MSSDPGLVSSASPDQLGVVAESQIFFGHQSVGGNVLDGIPSIYAEAGVPQPRVLESREFSSSPDPYLQHAKIGENRDPLGKIADFERIIRGGVGDEVEIAFMKFCYVDIHDGDDVQALFETYRTTLEALERDYPEVTFLHVTTPLTQERDLRAKIKALLGRGDDYGSEHNAAREAYNNLMRSAYGDSGRLFDLAAAESTAPDGTRVGGTTGGEPYFSLYEGYAKDPGHLNEQGSQAAANAFVTAVATARAGEQPSR